MTVLAWARERLANTRRLADLKTGADRAGWLEDAAYWEQIVAALAAAPVPIDWSKQRAVPFDYAAATRDGVVACCQPAPDRSGRACDKPKGHDGLHWTYGGATFTW